MTQQTMFSSCRIQKLCLVFSILLIMFLLVFKVWYFSSYTFGPFTPLKYFTDGQKSNELIDGKKSSEIYQAPKFAQFHSCPACFGYKVCREVDMSSLIFHGEMPAAQNSKLIWKKGVLKNMRILISSPSSEEWSKFDDYICLNSSHGGPCDISSAIRRTYLGSEEILTLRGLRNLYQLFDSPRKVPMSVCASRHFLSELKKIFDDDYDGYLSKEEQSMLFTSMLMHPGYVVAKFQSRSGVNIPKPTVVGACGRSVIIEGGLVTLAEMLSEPFDDRVGLALQVLQLVEDFEAEDPLWYYLYTGFSIENLAVTKTGEVIALDLSEIIILDKSAFLPGSVKVKRKDELCNVMCFQKITQDLLYSDEVTSCAPAVYYSQLMYAVVCKQVISDLKEHKEEGFFNFDGHRIHRKSEFSGLLHSLPSSCEEQVEELLRECVQETRPGGRMKAVSELREFLENYKNANEAVNGPFVSKGAILYSSKAPKQYSSSYDYEGHEPYDIGN